MQGKLFLVATPIGNLQDITLRALETLKTVDLIACEDTRHTQKLLNRYDIKKKLVSYHEHNEQTRADELAQLLSEGKNIAVVSDAGTPAICDPSFRIVQKAHEIGVKIIPIPGAVAFVNALIVSGLPTDSHFFGGFLPAKKGERIARLKELKGVPATLVFYEAPHRIEKSLADCLEVLGNRQAVIAREITKLHEEVLRGTFTELIEKISVQPVKGEIVLVIDRENFSADTPETSNVEQISLRFQELQKQGLDRKQALKKIAREFGLNRSETYRLLVTAQK